MEENLINALQYEMNRNRELLEIYRKIPTGVFGVSILEKMLEQAENAINNNDVIEMLTAYQDLQKSE